MLRSLQERGVPQTVWMVEEWHLREDSEVLVLEELGALVLRVGWDRQALVRCVAPREVLPVLTDQVQMACLEWDRAGLLEMAHQVG